MDNPRDQVFVDGTGRRRRWLNGVGGLLSIAILAYVVLLGASLARAPWAPRVRLPGLGDVLAPSSPKKPPALGHLAVVTPLPGSKASGVHSPVGPVGSAASRTRAGGASSSFPTGTTTFALPSGSSASAPGRTITTTAPAAIFEPTATTATTLAPGNSGSAPGHTLTTTAPTTTLAPGNSGSAPGRTIVSRSAKSGH